MNLAELRREYQMASLTETEVDADPFRQFDVWMQQALKASLTEPYAMILATATPEGKPSARTVLLRGYDAGGFRFFTNYQSRKGQELAANPWATLLFFWAELERQIRIEGRVEKTTDAVSDAYFQSRPRESRLSALASAQSEVIPNRQVLEERMKALDFQYPGDVIPRPPHWGGYQLIADSFEFWQGGPHRLHDRIRYVRQEGGWRIERLSP